MGVGSDVVELLVPAGWTQNSKGTNLASGQLLAWSSSEGDQWLAIRQLQFDSPAPARDATLYLTNLYVDDEGDVVIQLCGHCFEVKSRCRAEIGGRRAVVAEGAYRYSPQVIALWPLGGDKWLAVGSGAVDTTDLQLLRARIRRVEFR